MTEPNADSVREQLALLVVGRMAMHWPLQCPMCPDRAVMALDITDAILASGIQIDSSGES